MRRAEARRGCACVAALLLWATALTAAARDFRFELPPQQALDWALAAWSEITGVQLIYSPESTRARLSPGLDGVYSADAALTRLLAGSGLGFRYSAPGTVTIEPAGADARTLGVVQVSGAATPTSAAGSRDPLATEGSGSYAAFAAGVGSPFPQPLKDTPRAVSVLTQERLQDQNVTELPDALLQLPGVTISGLPTDAAIALVRGFRIRDVQIDGGAPLLAANDTLQGDLVIYDRIELLRGADGLGNGYVSPGGIVNLVRKRPLDHAQLVVETQGGSFDRYTGLVDASGPLGLGGRLRGRALVSGIDKGYFYETADLQRASAYGVTEADLWPGALLGVGGRYVDQRTTPWSGGGLPFGRTSQLGLRRDTSFILPWERDDLRLRQVFATLEQQLGAWDARLVYDRLREDSERLAAGLYGSVDPDTGDGLTLGFPDASERQRVQTLADLKLRRRFDWLGRTHSLSVNANRGSDVLAGTSFDTDQGGFTPVNIYDFSPADYPAPVITGVASSGGSRLYRASANMSLTLNPWAPLQLIGSYRWNRYESRTSGGGSTQEYTDEHAAPSYFGATWALEPRWNLYASWAHVYESNAALRTPSGKPPDPVVGDNYELGVKYASIDESLQGTLALYRVERRDFVEFVGTSDDPRCCFVNGDDFRVVAEGVDVELAGTVLPGWQLAASYAYNINSFEGPATPNPGGRFNRETPKHLFKLWTNWRPTTAPWSLIEIGGGVYAQSRADYVPVFVFDPDAGPQFVEIPQGGYAVFAARVGWRLGPHWEAALKIDNLLDRVYYVSQDSSGGNLYGAPRSWLVTLRATY